MKFSFDIRYSLFDILRFKKSPQMQWATNVRDKLSEWNCKNLTAYDQYKKHLFFLWK